MNDLAREDELFDRALSEGATPDEWGELEALAGRDPALWQRLARSLRDNRALTTAAEEAGALAAAVELPAGSARRPAPRPVWLERMGWMAALIAVAIGAALWSGDAPAIEPQEPLVAEAPPAGTEPDTRLAMVVDELPKVVVGSRALARGGPYEVLYMRRVLERAVVDRLYERGVDEYGRPAAVPFVEVASVAEEL